jgi:hypothetical protein
MIKGLNAREIAKVLLGIYLQFMMRKVLNDILEKD